MINKKAILVAIATTLVVGGACAHQVHKPITWESEIKDPGVRDFREAVYSSFVDNTERIEQLERKVAGMQKQITLLHGKKQDKPLPLTGFYKLSAHE